jgi:L-serine dehydratase
MKKDINTFSDLLLICGQTKKPLWKLVQEREAFMLDVNVEDIRAKVKKSLDAMKNAIETGLKSNEKSISNQCGDDCEKLQQKYQRHPALLGKLFEKVTTYALATIEENLRMGKIVACPTAGSCAIVPSVLVAASEELEVNEEGQINALITAGAIGSIISNKVALAGAIAGCQAECGAAAAMSAGALVQIMGGTNKQMVHAVALALKNVLGLTCDPVAGLVEIPCVKRNAFLAIHALTAVELALAGIESKIPPDEVVDAMAQTGQLMSPLLKECSQAGLAKTKTALKIEKKFRAKTTN